MKSNILLLAGAACGAALLLGGCGATMNAIEPAGTVAPRQMLSDTRISTDAALHNRLQSVGVNTSTGPSGFLTIQIEVQNTGWSAQTFTYRIEWLDENDMIINTPAAVAAPRSIEGGETLAVPATAPTDRAKTFRINFLKAD